MKLEDIPEPLRTKIQVDKLIFGNAFILKKDGKYERIDPMRVKLNVYTGEFEIQKEDLK